MIKMNNKGFAVSTILYGILSLTILILMLIFGVMRSNKNINASLVESLTETMDRCVSLETKLDNCYFSGSGNCNTILSQLENCIGNHNNTPSGSEGSNPDDTYTITVSAGTGGTVTPGTSTVIKGSSKTFTITPNSDYKISEVLVDGVAQTKQEEQTIIGTTVNQKHILHSKSSEEFFRFSNLRESLSDYYDWYIEQKTPPVLGSVYYLEGLVERGENSCEDMELEFEGTGTLNINLDDLDGDGLDDGDTYVYVDIYDDTGNPYWEDLTEDMIGETRSYDVYGSVRVYLELCTLEDWDGEADDDAEAAVYINFEDKATTGMVTVPVTSYTFSNINANHTLTAKFARK